MSLTKATYSMIQGAVTNVLDYGAKGDGVTDDSAAIQSALDVGSVIYFPKGTYLIKSALLPKTTQTIFGDGVNVTKIKADTNNMIMLSYPSGSYSNVFIKNLTIDGNSKADTGIKFVGSAQGAVSNCEFFNISAGGCLLHQFYAKNATYCVFERLALNGFGGDYGLLLDYCYSSEVKNSIIYNGNAANMLVNSGSDVRYSNNYFFNESSNPNPALVILDSTLAHSFVDCDFEPQGAANVTYNVILKDTGPSTYPVSTDNSFTRCRFIGSSGTSTNCVAVGTTGSVYKTRFTECGFIKPTSTNSVTLITQAETSFSRCYDLVTYDTATYSPVTITNGSGNAYYIENITGNFGTLTPSSDATIDLGNGSLRWNKAWVQIVNFLDGSRFFTVGSGSPEGVVTGSVGCLYTRTNGGAGTTLYIKEAGVGNTGWAAK